MMGYYNDTLDPALSQFQDHFAKSGRNLPLLSASAESIAQAPLSHEELERFAEIFKQQNDQLLATIEERGVARDFFGISTPQLPPQPPAQWQSWLQEKQKKGSTSTRACMTFEMAERQVQDKTLILPQLNPSQIPAVLALTPSVPPKASTVPGKHTRRDTTTCSGPRGAVH
jgi:hypothetical protein